MDCHKKDDASLADCTITVGKYRGQKVHGVFFPWTQAEKNRMAHHSTAKAKVKAQTATSNLPNISARSFIGNGEHSSRLCRSRCHSAPSLRARRLRNRPPSQMPPLWVRAKIGNSRARESADIQLAIFPAMAPGPTHLRVLPREHRLPVLRSTRMIFCPRLTRLIKAGIDLPSAIECFHALQDSVHIFPGYPPGYVVVNAKDRQLSKRRTRFHQPNGALLSHLLGYRIPVSQSRSHPSETISDEVSRPLRDGRNEIEKN